MGQQGLMGQQAHRVQLDTMGQQGSMGQQGPRVQRALREKKGLRVALVSVVTQVFKAQLEFMEIRVPRA